MTQRERRASGGVTEAVRPSAGPTALSRSAPAADSIASRLHSWDDLFKAASPAQQTELLALARRQGLLYAHQLPTLANGPPSDANRQLIARLLSGQTGELEPVRPAPLTLFDTALDPIQAEAVARALATPDLCLIQGLPGTGKSRVAAEIVTQAAARGERVLLLAPTVAPLDRVLEQIGDRPEVCAIRCLAREERPGDLPPGLAALTFAERLRGLREQTLTSARKEVESLDRQLQQFQQEEPLWDRLNELAEHQRLLDAQRAELEQRRNRVPAEVEQEATQAETAAGDAAAEFPTLVARAARRRLYNEQAFDRELAALREQIEQRHKELSDLTTRITAIRPLADAKEQKRWWTGAWWRATFLENAAAQLAELEGVEKQARENMRHLEEEIRQITQRQAEACAAALAERADLLKTEVARRQAEIDDQREVLQREQQLVEDKWQGITSQLQAESPRPAGKTVEAVAEARGDWRARRERLQQQHDFARQWAAGLEQLADSAPARLAAFANVVAAPSPALATDPHFGDGTPHGSGFDLLVLEEAHLLTESEFLHVARRARRWVLIGACDPAVSRGVEPEPARNTSAAAPSRTQRVPTFSRTRGSALLRPSFFQRLWQALHCDPRHWPATWVQENGRLCCRLRPLTAEQRQHLESERLADFPDIELRILALPRAEPTLAEVIFPPSMSIQQAKAYLFRELDELPVWALGHSLRWYDEGDHLVLRLTDTPPTNPVVVPLGAGIHEFVSASAPEPNGNGLTSIAWHTCRLEFDRRAGWHRERAEEWVGNHLGVRDLGRTVRLDVPHRMQPELAAFVSEVLFNGAYAQPLCPHGPGANGGLQLAGGSVEFVPVPPLEAESRGKPDGRKSGDRRRPANDTRPRPSRGGAGLELDLTDPRHRDRLPSEMRPRLPERGLVNYLEAQTIVRVLEAMLAGDREGSPGTRLTDLDANGRPTPAVAVMALYAAQVELIRQLVQQSPTLAGAPLAVDLPTAFRERECGVVLLSLTRSHAHRAVPFGDDPQLLTLALTRARCRLVLFGDPGTLARRSQWEGPLDHLDEADAARERDLAGRLVAYLNGQGAHARAFRVREGTSR